MKTYTKKEVNEWWDSLEDYAQAYFNSEYGEPTFKDKENQLKFYDSLCCRSDSFVDEKDALYQESISIMKELVLEYPDNWAFRLLFNRATILTDPNICDWFYEFQKENNWDGAASLLEDYVLETHRLKRLLRLFAELVDPEKFKEKLMPIDTDPKPEDTPEISQDADSPNILHGGN